MFLVPLIRSDTRGGKEAYSQKLLADSLVQEAKIGIEPILANQGGTAFQ